MIEDSQVILALMLTVFAGLSTGIGSAIAYLIKKPNTSYLSLSLGFSAGVMVYVSFVELLPDALEVLAPHLGVLAFFLGIFIIAIIDMIIPEHENPHHFENITEQIQTKNLEAKLKRTGVFTALAIAIHNFPEGLATFGTALVSIELGAVIALAIAIHNIPEGIAVSMPIFYATGSRKKAFSYSFLSGLAEPLGAVIGFLLLRPFLNETILVSLLAFVAGIMVYISIDELLPMAHLYGKNHTVIAGFVIGMLIMAISLLML